MAISLSAIQCRVIGVMLEKEVTTPEQYPLSLNGLTNACNQKSNREPVLSLTENEVQDAVNELMAKNLVSDEGAFSGRVAKYSHRFCNTTFGDLHLSDQQRAVVCVLLLRGAQTPGELRTRTNRLASFENVTEVEQVLTQLQNLDGKCYVKKLAREPGKRESRYLQLFSDDVDETIVDSNNANESNNLNARVEQLEQEVNMLKKQVSDLLAELS